MSKWRGRPAGPGRWLWEPMKTTREPERLPSDLPNGLIDPLAYPGDVGTVELIETHISYLFLTGDHVYKVKKPVDLGFLDFTTLAKRREFCLEEVSLNQRLAPGVYQEVVPISIKDGRYAVEGSGETVEYAVKMRRLPSERSLEALL